MARSLPDEWPSRNAAVAGRSAPRSSIRSTAWQVTRLPADRDHRRPSRTARAIWTISAPSRTTCPLARRRPGSGPVPRPACRRRSSFRRVSSVCSWLSSVDAAGACPRLPWSMARYVWPGIVWWCRVRGARPARLAGRIPLAPVGAHLSHLLPRRCARSPAAVTAHHRGLLPCSAARAVLRRVLRRCQSHGTERYESCCRATSRSRGRWSSATAGSREVHRRRVWLSGAPRWRPKGTRSERCGPALDLVQRRQRWRPTQRSGAGRAGGGGDRRGGSHAGRHGRGHRRGRCGEHRGPGTVGRRLRQVLVDEVTRRLPAGGRFDDAGSTR